MRVIAFRRLRDHWKLPGRGDSEQPLKSWYAIVTKADWHHFAGVKSQFRTASAVGERVVFNIGGNKYRLVTYINYRFHIVYVRFVGTHPEYDELDIEEV